MGLAFGGRTKGRGCWKPPPLFPSLLASSPAWPQACIMLWALEKRQTPPPERPGPVPEADAEHASWSKAGDSLEPEPRSLCVQARLPCDSCSDVRSGNPEGLSIIQAGPAGQEAGVFLAMVSSSVCVTASTSLLLSELFLYLCHGAFLAPRTSELIACLCWGPWEQDEEQGTESRR